jgi:hypothetical protein
MYAKNRLPIAFEFVDLTDPIETAHRISQATAQDLFTSGPPSIFYPVRSIRPFDDDSAEKGAFYFFQKNQNVPFFWFEILHVSVVDQLGSPPTKVGEVRNESPK